MQTGKLLLENRIHDGDIKDLRASLDGTHFITASTDKTAKIVDALDLTVLKEYQFDRPANTADMSPIADHVSVLAKPATLLLPPQGFCTLLLFLCQHVCTQCTGTHTSLGLASSLQLGCQDGVCGSGTDLQLSLWASRLHVDVPCM